MRAALLCLAFCLASPSGAETVTVKGTDYTYLPYEAFEAEQPDGWFAFRYDASEWLDEPVMIPFGVTFCDLLAHSRVAESLPKSRLGQSYLFLNDPVGSFVGAITSGFLVEDTDMEQMRAASKHCDDFAGQPNAGGLFRDPLFFFYGVLRQDPSEDKPGKYLEPWIDLHGAIFSEQYGQSAWLPTYGAKPPPMKIPKEE